MLLLMLLKVAHRTLFAIYGALFENSFTTLSCLFSIANFSRINRLCKSFNRLFVFNFFVLVWDLKQIWSLRFNTCSRWLHCHSSLCFFVELLLHLLIVPMKLHDKILALQFFHSVLWFFIIVMICRTTNWIWLISRPSSSIWLSPVFIVLIEWYSIRSLLRIYIMLVLFQLFLIDSTPWDRSHIHFKLIFHILLFVVRYLELFHLSVAIFTPLGWFVSTVTYIYLILVYCFHLLVNQTEDRVRLQLYKPLSSFGLRLWMATSAEGRWTTLSWRWIFGILRGTCGYFPVHRWITVCHWTWHFTEQQFWLVLIRVVRVIHVLYFRLIYPALILVLLCLY